MDINKLKYAIARAGYTQKSLAAELGYSKNGFNLKVNGKLPLNIDEVTVICSKLGIVSTEEKVDIFLKSVSQ